MMENYWQWRWERDCELKRIYCEKQSSTLGDVERASHETLRTISRQIGYNPESLLDYGCGMSRISKLMFASHYHGVDIVEGVIEDQLKFNPGYDFSVIDKYGEPILSGDKKFDVILARGVFQHLDDETASIVLTKMLTKCNKLVVWSPVGSIEQKLRHEGSTASAPLTRHPKEMIDLLIDNGYNIVLKENSDCHVVAEPRQK